MYLHARAKTSAPTRYLCLYLPCIQKVFIGKFHRHPHSWHLQEGKWLVPKGLQALDQLVECLHASCIIPYISCTAPLKQTCTTGHQCVSGSHCARQHGGHFNLSKAKRLPNCDVFFGFFRALDETKDN